MRRDRDQRLSLEQQKRLSRARILGSATALPIYLEDHELLKLLSVVLADIGQPRRSEVFPALPAACEGDYYKIPLAWFEESYQRQDFVDAYLVCTQTVPDFDTYFGCLCELHKRRKKYARILSAQPLPTMLQVSPRALLEFGTIPTPALASWIMWRKWFYDIDNRAAQETGYLFEPILASALGGQPYGARNSPIKRASAPTKGRQVDCIVDRRAYEFKLRVTIAASGQGRFTEELEFARDCQASQFEPVLLVLDPTPSTRLTGLSAEFRRVGGAVYVGDAAWQHLESESGPIMATLIEKYVRRPIAALDAHAVRLLDLHAAASADGKSIGFQMGEAPSGFAWTIPRAELPELAAESDRQGQDPE
jgi:hypothetical protein